jgi:hypothetical protein
MNIENHVAICPAHWSGNPNDPAAPIAPPVCACCNERVRPGLLESCSVPNCQYEDLCPYCRTKCVDCGKVHCLPHVDACEHAAARATEEEEKREMEKPKVGDILAHTDAGGYAFVRIILESSALSDYTRFTSMMICPDGRLYSIEPSTSRDSFDDYELVGHIQIGKPAQPAEQPEASEAEPAAEVA